MAKKELTVITIDVSSELTLKETCELCGITPEWLAELISYGVIESHATHIDAKNLRRIHRLLRLQRDLEVNLAGAVLALDLIDQIENLQTQVELFEKYLTSSR